MKKIKIYLDTSIISMLTATDDLSMQEVTEKFFLQNKNQNFYISELVMAELLRTKNEERRLCIINSLKNFSFEVLKINDDIKNLADEYIKRDIIPQKYYDDAVHISIATYYEMDVIVSWNFKHIVQRNTKICTKAINLLFGYKEVDIESPWEMINYEN